MGRISENQHRQAIKIRKKRQAKFTKLRGELAKATGTAEKKLIREKVRKLAPWLTEREFDFFSKKEIK